MPLRCRPLAVSFACAMCLPVVVARAQGGPPIVGLQLLMGEKAPLMMQNVLAGMRRGIFEPMEIVAVKK